MAMGGLYVLAQVFGERTETPGVRDAALRGREEWNASLRDIDPKAIE